jgi:hypothetical protein
MLGYPYEMSKERRKEGEEASCWISPLIYDIHSFLLIHHIASLLEAVGRSTCCVLCVVQGQVALPLDLLHATKTRRPAYHSKVHKDLNNNQ